MDVNKTIANLYQHEALKNIKIDKKLKLENYIRNNPSDMEVILKQIDKMKETVIPKHICPTLDDYHLFYYDKYEDDLEKDKIIERIIFVSFIDDVIGCDFDEPKNILRRQRYKYKYKLPNFFVSRFYNGKQAYDSNFEMSPKFLKMVGSLQ